MTMDRENVLLLAGQLAGLAMRASVAEFQDAAASPGLTPANQMLVECAICFRQDLDRRQKEAERDRLWAALSALFAFVEDGTLVRNINRDAEPGWAMRQVPLVKALADASAALGIRARQKEAR